MHYGFLLNHYAGHQAYHSLPIAYELSSRHPEHQVTIVAATDELYQIAKQMGTHWPDNNCKLLRAHVPAFIDAIDPYIKKFVLIRKRAILEFNTKIFKDMDVLIIPEKNSLQLKKKHRLSKLKFVRIRHGAGDRDTGLDESNQKFDLILASGQKMKDRLMSGPHIDSKKIAIIGYPKFDIIDKLPPPQPIFTNGKPVVIYNPHYKNTESSWQIYGRQVLEFFRKNQNYNLIFAPHIILYERALRHNAFALDEYESCPNIFVDTGSQASIDMTYTRQADIYLGDVSSQIYEFLHTPRPCIFINAHNVKDWENSEQHLHWRTGDVITTIDQLKVALNAAQQQFYHYKPIQEEILRYTFDVQKQSAAERAAHTLTTFLYEGAIKS